MPLPLIAPRVVLRDWTAEDLDDAMLYAADEQVVRFMPWGPNDRAQTAAFLDAAREHSRTDPRLFFELAVESRESGRVIGGAGLRLIRPLDRLGEIGYVLRRDHWGRGLGTEIAQTLLKFGFTEHMLHRIYAGVDTENIASQRVLEKAGLQREAHLRSETYRRGEWRDSFLYAILEDEWRARHGA